MEKFLTPELYDTYLEMCLGSLSLRVPQVQDFMARECPIALIKSSYSDRGQDLILDVRSILAEIRRQGVIAPKNLRKGFTEINSMFLVLAWEILKGTTTHNALATNEDVQFFRHVRNACAHDGVFNFGTLNRPAKWRDKEITDADNGQPIFPSFLMDGDPIFLLIDINNKYYEPIHVDGYIPYVP